MVWQPPKTNWTGVDGVQDTDMNRIEGNIAELNTMVTDGKAAIADSITAMGQAASASDTHAQLAAKIRDISDDATATTSDVLATKTFYQGGVKRTGNIPSKGAATITPSTVNQTIAAGQYLSGIQTIAGDPDLVAANILSGKNIFGVAGALDLGFRNNRKLFVDFSYYDPAIYVSDNPLPSEYYKVNPTKNLVYAVQLRKDGSGYYTGGFGWEVDVTGFTKLCYVGQQIDNAFYMALFTQRPRNPRGEVSATSVLLSGLYHEVDISAYSGTYWASIYTKTDCFYAEVECVGFWVE